MAVTTKDIQQLYIAYFNRPADFQGLKFQVNAANATSFEAVAEGFANSPEFKLTYAGLSDADYVNALYVNLFGRPAESGGKAFWLDLLKKGVVTHGSLALELLKGAINQDKVTIANKVAATEAFYSTMESSGKADYYAGSKIHAQAKQWLSGVTTTESFKAATSPATLHALLDPLISTHEAVPLLSLPAGAVSGSGNLLSVDMSKAPGVTSLQMMPTVGGSLTVNNAPAGFTLAQTGASTGMINLALANDQGTGDALRLAFTGADGYSSGSMVSVSGVETLRITTYDTAFTSANSARIVLPVSALHAKTVTLTGTLGVDLSGGLTQSGLTSLDASGLSGSGAMDGLRFSAGQLSASAVIKGAAAAANLIDFSAASKAVAYMGGSGADTLNFTTANSQDNTVVLGDGVNVFNGATAHGNNTITSGKDADTIRLGSGQNAVTTGAGDDTVVTGAGLNKISLGAGKDLLQIGAVNQSASLFSIVTDIGAGDRIDTGLAMTNATGKLGAAIPATHGSYPGFLNAAAGKGTGAVSWFHFGGDTFIVQDRGPAGTFIEGTDLIVKLAGVVDLSNSTLEAGASILTIV